MPGLDQRGPLGQGAMTGGRQGICQDRGPAGPADRFGRGGRRGCRGRGFGRGYAPPVQFTQAEPTKSELEDRARELEDELNAVKSQMKAMSDEN